MEMRERVIVAADLESAESCQQLLDRLYPTIKMFKLGSQLFTAAGHEVINIFKRKGAGCFLDLKFHDIPATVERAAAAATGLGVEMFDVHTFGGVEMMKRALEASRETARRLTIERPLILGVTVLTSMNRKDLKDLGIKRPPRDQVLYLAELAKRAGLDGVVASANEIRLLKENLGRDFVVVTPGIRPAAYKRDDQKRTATPKEAFERGADYIVIGRPITEAKDPKAAAGAVIEGLR